MRLSWLVGCAVCLIGLVGARSAWAVDRVEEFNKAKRPILQQLHHKEASKRVEALDRLREFPIADAVKLVCGALADADERVRDAALTTLVEMSGKEEVCETLLAMVKKSVNRKDDMASAAPLLVALLSSSLGGVQRATNDFLERLSSSKNGAAVVIALADELAAHHQPCDVQPLVRLAKTKVFAGHFGVRRAVVHALTQIRSAEAIGGLIEIMSQVQGEAQADAVEHLAGVTGQIFGMETAAWQRWWAEVHETFAYPTRWAPAPYRSVSMESSGNYYGLPLFAERLVFVLDTSGSMTGQRIAAAKRELDRAIAGLPPHVAFSIVVFNRGVTVWQNKLVPATDQWKQAAISYVNGQDTHSNTASYDALEAAFQFDTEAIYFLSDGAPHGGKITAPVDIVAAISAANKSRRISLYTIGIGAGIPGSPFDVFMKALAEQNLGLYRRVDG